MQVFNTGELLTLYVLIGVLTPVCYLRNRSGPEVIKLFSCSVEQFIMLINVKNANNCWHLSFISLINSTFESKKARQVLIIQHLSFY